MHKAGLNESSGDRSAPRHQNPSSRSLSDGSSMVHTAASRAGDTSTTGMGGHWDSPSGHSCRPGSQGTRDSHRNPAKVQAGCCALPFKYPGSSPVPFAEAGSKLPQPSLAKLLTGTCCGFHHNLTLLEKQSSNCLVPSVPPLLSPQLACCPPYCSSLQKIPRTHGGISDFICI